MSTLLNRITATFTISGMPEIKTQMLNWSRQFNICCFLDDHHYNIHPHSYECLLGAGAVDTLRCSAGTAFMQLRDFSDKYNDWLFGHFAYDLKNETEALHSNLPDNIGFDDLLFFIPQTVIQLGRNEMTISSYADPVVLFRDICNSSPAIQNSKTNDIRIYSRYNRDEYLSTVRELKQHILRGDCYEINFCQEFYAENVTIDPLSTYLSLTTVSPNPFAAFYRDHDKFLLCASPERFLKKNGKQVLSQPIKGTSKRDLANSVHDREQKDELLRSQKERSENVMVVDLVRNDLSKICTESSVKVDELFGIYSFPQVHQMISTVSGEIRPDIHWTDAISATFPMGSMTGAPKKRVMELIEKYERTRRGMFSGAVGYVTPARDFDFNVVIRSILYNETARYLSYQAGSGITFYSDPEQEYEECLLKAEAIRQVLS